MPKKTSKTWLRPAKDFPTPLFLVTFSFMIGLAAGVLLAVHYLI